jgi:hypothetical protein
VTLNENDAERFNYAADKMAAALREMEIAYAEVLGLNTALDANLRLAMKHASRALDLTTGEATRRWEVQ